MDSEPAGKSPQQAYLRVILFLMRPGEEVLKWILQSAQRNTHKKLSQTASLMAGNLRNL